MDTVDKDTETTLPVGGQPTQGMVNFVNAAKETCVKQSLLSLTNAHMLVRVQRVTLHQTTRR